MCDSGNFTSAVFSAAFDRCLLPPNGTCSSSAALRRARSSRRSYLLVVVGHAVPEARGDDGADQ